MRVLVAFGLGLTILVSSLAAPREARAQTAASACEAAPTVACVLQLAREAARNPPDRLNLNRVAERYLQAGDKALAADVAGEMVAIVAAQEEAARAEPPIEPKTANEAVKRRIEAYKRESRSYQARNRVWSLVDAAILYGRTGDVATAKSVLDRAKAAGDAIADPRFRAQALDKIPPAKAKLGELVIDEGRGADANSAAPREAAAAIAECTPGASPIVRPVLDEQGHLWELKSGTPSSRLQELAVVALERGDHAQALAIARGITDPHQCFYVLMRYAEVRARQGDVPGALAVAEGLRNDWFRSLIIESIALARANASDIEGALETARSIPQPAARHRAFNEIAIALAKSGRVAAALAIVDTNLPDLRFSFGARIEIATALAKSGDADAARTILVSLQVSLVRLEPSPMLRGLALEEFHQGRAMALAKVGDTFARLLDSEGMAGFIRTLNRPVDRASFLALLARELAIAGKREAANRALAEALEVTAAIPDLWERAMADRVLAQAEVALGNIAAARQRVSSQPTSSHQDSVLKGIIETLCAMRDHGAAIRIAADMSYPAGRFQQLLFIAESLSGMSR